MRVYQKHAGDDAKLLVKFHWPYANILPNTNQWLSYTENLGLRHYVGFSQIRSHFRFLWCLHKLFIHVTAVTLGTAYHIIMQAKDTLIEQSP